MKRLVATLALATVALAAAACGSTNAGAPTPAGPAGPVDPNAPVIIAKDIEFAPGRRSTVPADKAFSLTFDNQDGAPAQRRDLHGRHRASTPVSVGEIVSVETKVTARSRRSRRARTSSGATSTRT